jgi:hypothetical protein
MSYVHPTKKERKEGMRGKYFGRKEKIFAITTFVIAMLILLWTFVFSLTQNFDPILPVAIFVGMLVFGMAGVLFIDIIFWETE